MRPAPDAGNSQAAGCEWRKSSRATHQTGDPITAPAGAGFSGRCELEDQATLGGGWMPWGQEPMKGAAYGETPRGAASTLGSGDARMRQRLLRDGRRTASAVGNRGN